jgi:hypothetical protein
MCHPEEGYGKPHYCAKDCDSCGDGRCGGRRRGVL